MKTIIGLLFFLAILYCGVGVIMALYEKVQSDNKFDYKTIFMWLPKMLGKA